MEVTSILLILFITILLIKYFKRQSTVYKLPPGPRKLPLIGNIHQLASKNTLPHRRLAELARVYGPIMHLRLGEVPHVVISSAEMAREVMKTHDSLLCDRPKLLASEAVFYKCTDIAMAPYGEYWRQMRKIATLELFTVRRVQDFRGFREGAVLDFINNSVIPAAKTGSVVNLTSKVFALIFDITLRFSVTKKAQDEEKFRKLIKEVCVSFSGFSIGDLYPSTKLISVVFGMEKKLQDLVKRFDKILDPIIKEHLYKNKRGKEDQCDLLDTLLQFHDDNVHESNGFSLTMENIKAIMSDVFSAGSETSSTTIDWAMVELLKNPAVMKNAQEEVRRVIKDNTIMIDETSINKLKYLKLVIKETLRLHPPLPCLIPRESMGTCEINGYEIPPNTRVIINVWNIGRDHKYWKDPEMFNPNRFEDCSIDYKGNYFELIRFGAGRRICPGIGLGMATVELVLAMLLYHFDWKLPDGNKHEDLNMDETFGIVARRKCDLQVIPIFHHLSGLK